MTDQNEQGLILLLATSSASLDKSPKHNWVEDAGGLPPYVRKLARAIAKNGHSLDSAIAIAISRVKAWASGGGDVDADTRAKAAKAIAQWEALKAKNSAGGVVKASRDDGTEYIFLSSAGSYNTEIVRAAWDSIQRDLREAYDRSHPARTEYDAVNRGFQYQWINELGSDYIIVSQDDNQGQTKYRIPYTVDEDENVFFGEPVRIRQVWVEDSDDDGELTSFERRAIATVNLSVSTPLERISKSAKGL